MFREEANEKAQKNGELALEIKQLTSDHDIFCLGLFKTSLLKKKGKYLVAVIIITAS